MAGIRLGLRLDGDRTCAIIAAIPFDRGERAFLIKTTDSMPPSVTTACVRACFRHTLKKGRMPRASFSERLDSARAVNVMRIDQDVWRVLHG